MGVAKPTNESKIRIGHRKESSLLGADRLPNLGWLIS